MSEKGDKKPVEAYQWPTSHVGHLTSPQQTALEEFKQLSQSKGYFEPGSDAQPASHDDVTLLRYLRARKFVPAEAFEQFKSTEDWRRASNLDHLYETIDIHEYEQSRRLYPQWTGRRDKRGMPFYVYEVAAIDTKQLHAVETTEQDDSKASKKTSADSTPYRMLRLFALYENMCRFVLPLCSVLPDRPHHETPISQSNNIIDLNKVGMARLWSLRNHLQDASKLATAHYPETLDRIFIVGAPSFFSTIWEWAKKWFDPITVSKMFILNNSNMLSTLEKYVDKDSIPKKYGGNLDWNFGDMPALDATMSTSLRWKSDIMLRGTQRTVPIGPIAWEYDADGDLVAVAKGSDRGVPRHEVLARLHPESDVARLALSPGRAQQNPLFASVAGGNSGPTTAPTSTPAADAAPATYTVPYRDHDHAISSPPASGRQGTSATRFEQQASTHADGQLAHATPDVRGGQGSNAQTSPHAVMEPRTVGQAPKHTPLYHETHDTPGVLAHAQQLAGQAVATVAHTVGLAGKEEKVQEKREDPRIDGLEDQHVEAFLRSETMSEVAEKK